MYTFKIKYFLKLRKLRLLKKLSFSKMEKEVTKKVGSVSLNYLGRFYL